MTQLGDWLGAVVDIGRLRKAGAETFPGALAAKSLFPDSQFEVVLVRGPNARNDYHVEPYDELFIQIEGTICVDTREKDGVRRQRVRPGEVYVVPGGTPHSPLRSADTWGLVVEIRRRSGETEYVQWYCDRCDGLIEQVSMESSQMVDTLGQLLHSFQASEQRRTCQACGGVLPVPGPFVLDDAL